MKENSWKDSVHNRRYFVGGSDARMIMGDNEAALLRLWQEKRSGIEPEDLSGNPIVKLGLVTEPHDRCWLERNSGETIKEAQRRIGRPMNRCMGAQLVKSGKVTRCHV